MTPEQHHIFQLQVKKDILNSQIEELERHHLLMRTWIDMIHTERVRTEDNIKKKLKKAQDLAEQIEELLNK